MELELSNVDIVLLILTLFAARLTIGGGRINVLQSVVHLPLFAIYVMLIFSP